MKPFNRITARVAPLDRANVDTDAIIPKQFLKSIRRAGFGLICSTNGVTWTGASRRWIALIGRAIRISC